jgi:bla regulator protein BlaR1
MVVVATSLAALAAWPQDGPNSAYGPVFDVITIRRTSQGVDLGDGVQQLTGYVRCRGGIQTDAPVQRDPLPNVGVGGCGARSATVKEMLNAAYSLRPDAPRQALDEIIIGGPAWASTATFDVDARVGNASMVTNEQALIMLQNLLRDRFGLKFHRETRDVNGLALVQAKGGHKLKTAAGGQEEIFTAAPVVKGQHVPTAALVNLLAQRLGRVVVNETGLDGFYNFMLTWAPDPTEAGPKEGGSGAPPLTIALQQQLGLDLEPRRVKWDVLVIDGLRQPTVN